MTTLSRLKALFRWNSTSDTKIFSKEKIINFISYSRLFRDNINIISIIWDKRLPSDEALLEPPVGVITLPSSPWKKPGNHGYFVISELKRGLQISHWLYILSPSLFALLCGGVLLILSPSLLPGSSLGTDGSFSFSSCSLYEWLLLQELKFRSGSTSRASSSG